MRTQKQGKPEKMLQGCPSWQSIHSVGDGFHAYFQGTLLSCLLFPLFGTYLYGSQSE